MGSNGREMPLRVQRGDKADEAFGVKLFGRLYQEASAYVMDCEGQLELKIFDTAFGREDILRDWPKGVRLALYSNHPEGDMQPRADDLKNLTAMPEGTTLYIVCEDKCVRWDGQNK